MKLTLSVVYILKPVVILLLDLLFNFGNALNKVVVEKLVDWIANQLVNGEQDSPRVWTEGNQALEKDANNLFTHLLRVVAEE